MLYPDFIHQAIDLTIVEADNGLFYLDPMWKSILYDHKLDIKRISSFKTTWDEVFSVLKLEVERRNTVCSKLNDVVNWVYGIVIDNLDAIKTDTESEYFKILSEYAKTNGAKQSSES